jgi:hypothetical protein
MVNAHGGISKLSNVPIIIQTGNKTGAVPSQPLMLNPSSNTILLNSQGLKVILAFYWYRKLLI